MIGRKWVWMALEDLAVAAAVRALSTRSRHLQVTPVGMYGSRDPEELNRGLRPEDDARHPYEGPLYWEWWYFDAQLEDGHRCVLELQYPNLLKPLARQCFMLFNVYTPDGRQLNNMVPFPASEWLASRETCEVAVGENTVRGYYPEYRVHFRHGDLACDLLFTNLLPGWTRGTGEVMFGRPDRKRVFGWVVAQPRARVEGTLTVDGVTREVSGLGYHDHNWGNAFLPLYVSHWIWGRLFHERLTMIFAEVNTSRRCGRIRIPVLFLALDDRIVLESSRVEFQVAEYRTDGRGYQVYPSKIIFSFAERDVSGEFHLRVKEEMESIMTLAERLPAPALKLFGRAVAGPAYYRFLSDYRGHLRIGGEELELEGETHWEYMVLSLRRGEIPKPGVTLPL